MKVLQVTPRYPPQTGGVEQHVQAISEELVERGHEVTVLTADAREDGARRDVRNGVTIRRHRGVSPGNAYHVAPGLVRAVRQSTADVVHAHNYHSLPLVFASWGAGERRFVATTHYHGESASAFRNLLHAVYRPVAGREVRGADVVVAVSEWEREQLRTDFGVEATVIPNGIDVDRFETADPEVRERPYLLTVGRLEKYKGVQHVIRALDQVDYDLVVAGDGPYRSTLECEASKCGVSDRVSFLGYVDQARLPELYAGATVFVTMSSFESFGLTVGEALAAGTPVVVRPSGALAEWACRADVVAARPETLVSAIQDAATRTPDSSELPSWDEVVDALSSLYRR